tara:strand:+ start:327 stop:542 length:216 start_codon:yes stop_codon:yes gene_type:complete
MVFSAILCALRSFKMGEVVATLIGLLFMFGALSIFLSLILEKHDTRPVKHSVIDNDLTDVIIAEELFDDEN